MTALRLSLLGAFEARLDAGPALAFPRRKAQALLAYLCLHPGEPQARDKLAALLWGDTPDGQARHSLRQALAALRQSLAQSARTLLLDEGDAVAISPAAVEVDVIRFERLVADGTSEALEQAMQLYRGDLLEGFAVSEPPFEEWLVTERARLRELAVDALAKLLAHQAKLGMVEPAVQTAVRLLGLDPAQEAVHRVLMRLHARQGRRGAALRQYQACVNVLERELGVMPEAETKELYREILQTRPRVARTEAQAFPGSARLDRPASDTPIVGRDGELEQLRHALKRASQGEGAVALIQGDAGVGKSRLVEALLAEAVNADGHVLLGRAHESEQVLPFGPWVDALRAGRVVPDLVQELNESWRTELARLFPEVGQPNREPTAAEDYVRLFEALARTVHHLASGWPLLLVLEDLHWADEMSLRLLVFLARRMVDWRVLVVATVRAEELAEASILRRTIAQLGRQPRFLSLDLAPLSEAETVALVRALAKTGTDEPAVARLGEQLWRASEGNPFMIVETLRALRDQPVGEAQGALAVPPSVRELIAGRLERLSERGRRLTAVASVIGREFDFALLERAAGLGGPEAAEGVEELVGRRIFHVVGERLDFTHERIREVAYEQLLAPQRRLWHAAAARALEELHPDDLITHAPALGRHHHASEVWDRAHFYLAHAGAAAAARAAHREAIACFEQALSALGHLPPSAETTTCGIDLRLDIRHSCVPLLDHGRIIEHLREAEAAARSIGDRSRLGWVVVYRTHGLFLAGDSHGALEAGQQALAVAQGVGDPSLQESAHVYLGQVHHWVGNYRRGAELLRRNVTSQEGELARRGLGARQYVNTRTFLAWCLAELGEFSEAIERADEAIRAAESRASPYDLVYAYSGAGLAHLRQGDAERAITMADRAVELCQGRDFSALWAIPASILGLASALAGRLDHASALLERAVEVASTLGAPVLGFLGEVYLLAGRLEEASAQATRALALAVEGKERGWEAWARRLLGEIAARDPVAQAGRASEAYLAAMVLADDLGMRPLRAHCHLGVGRLHRRVGRHQEAREHLTTATTMYREMGMRFWLERAEGELEQPR